MICLLNTKYMLVYLVTYFRPVSSFPKKWMTTVLNTKLENTVNNPAIPVEGERKMLISNMCSIFIIKLVDV